MKCFCAQFFLVIVRRAKATAQVSIETGLVAGPVTELMQRRIVVVGGLENCLRSGSRNLVGVERGVAELMGDDGVR